MSLNPDQIVASMTSAAQTAFQENWDAVKSYAPVEFQKMALQIVSIANNVAAYQLNPENGYSPETAKLLFQMQRTACESVLVAVSQLTLIAIQNAMNAVLNALNQSLAGVLTFAV